MSGMDPGRNRAVHCTRFVRKGVNKEVNKGHKGATKGSSPEFGISFTTEFAKGSRLRGQSHINT
jgi:hypothetical protein